MSPHKQTIRTNIYLQTNDKVVVIKGYKRQINRYMYERTLKTILVQSMVRECAYARVCMYICSCVSPKGTRSLREKLHVDR